MLSSTLEATGIPIASLIRCQGSLGTLTETTHLFDKEYAVAIGSTPTPEVTFITPEHLKARLDAGEYLCLLDARESAEFDTAHIPWSTVVRERPS